MIKKHSKNDATMSMCLRCHMWTSAHKSFQTFCTIFSVSCTQYQHLVLWQ